MLAKAKYWTENTEVHSAEVIGPFPHGEGKFAAIFRLDDDEADDQRSQLEEGAVYHVEDGKIVREEFFFDMGG